MAKLFRILIPPAGRRCRSCAEPIQADDVFGLSEGVCAPCRDDR